MLVMKYLIQVVISEKGDSSSLAAKQEILQILQAALGEKITRQE